MDGEKALAQIVFCLNERKSVDQWYNDIGFKYIIFEWQKVEACKINGPKNNLLIDKQRKTLLTNDPQTVTQSKKNKNLADEWKNFVFKRLLLER